MTSTTITLHYNLSPTEVIDKYVTFKQKNAWFVFTPELKKHLSNIVDTLNTGSKTETDVNKTYNVNIDDVYKITISIQNLKSLSENEFQIIIKSHDKFLFYISFQKKPLPDIAELIQSQKKFLISGVYPFSYHTNLLTEIIDPKITVKNYTVKSTKKGYEIKLSGELTLKAEHKNPGNWDFLYMYMLYKYILYKYILQKLNETDAIYETTYEHGLGISHGDIDTQDSIRNFYDPVFEDLKFRLAYVIIQDLKKLLNEIKIVYPAISRKPTPLFNIDEKNWTILKKIENPDQMSFVLPNGLVLEIYGFQNHFPKYNTVELKKDTLSLKLDNLVFNKENSEIRLSFNLIGIIEISHKMYLPKINIHLAIPEKLINNLNYFKKLFGIIDLLFNGIDITNGGKKTLYTNFKQNKIDLISQYEYIEIVEDILSKNVDTSMHMDKLIRFMVQDEFYNERWTSLVLYLISKSL